MLVVNLESSPAGEISAGRILFSAMHTLNKNSGPEQISCQKQLYYPTNLTVFLVRETLLSMLLDFQKAVTSQQKQS